MTKFREKFKDVIRQHVSTLVQSSPTYTAGIASFQNSDGTILVTDSNGVQVTAFPKYPIVLGQNVILVNDGKGNYSAVPIGTQVKPTEHFSPHFFSGGIGVRFGSLQPGGDIYFYPDQSVAATIGSPINPPPSPPTCPIVIDFQDQGDSKVYRLTFPDLDQTWNIRNVGPQAAYHPTVSTIDFGHVAFSPNRAHLAVSLSGQSFAGSGDRKCRIRHYYIGPKLQSAGVIDAGTNLYALQATLVTDYLISNLDTNVAITLADTSPPPYNTNITFTGLESLGGADSMFVTNSGVVYFLQHYQLGLSGPSVFTPDVLPKYLLPAPNYSDFLTVAATSYSLAYIKRLNANGTETLIKVLIEMYENGRVPVFGGTTTWAQWQVFDLLYVADDLSSIKVLGVLPNAQSQTDPNGTINLPAGVNNFANCSYVVSDVANLNSAAYGPAPASASYDPSITIWNQLQQFPIPVDFKTGRSAFFFSAKTCFANGFGTFMIVNAQAGSPITNVELIIYDRSKNSYREISLLNLPTPISSFGTYGGVFMSTSNIGHMSTSYRSPGTGQSCVSNLWKITISGNLGTVSLAPEMISPGFTLPNQNNVKTAGWSQNSTYYSQVLV